MARYNIVKNIRKRKIIILVVLLILIMVSWLIWGNLSVETNKLTVTSNAPSGSVFSPACGSGKSKFENHNFISGY